MYELAKDKDPTLQRAEAQLRGALADKKIVLSQMGPRVDANMGLTTFSHVVHNSGPADIRGEFTGYNYSTMLRQPLFNGPLWASLDSSKAGVREARDGVLVASQDLMVRVSELYFAVLKARSDVQIASKEEERLTQILQQTKSFLQKGTGDIIAVHEAQARVDSSHSLLIKAENDRSVAEQRLAVIAGVDSIRELAGVSSVEPAEPDPASMDAWLAMATENHPVIRKARESLHMAEYNLVATKRLDWPTMDMSGGYTVSKGSTFLPEVETRQWLIGVNVAIPIFNSFGTEAKISKSRAAVAEQKAVVNESEEQVHLRTGSLFLAVKNSATLIKSLEQQKKSAEVQLKATRTGNSIGTRTALDLLNAEQKYAASLRDLANAGYDHLHFQITLKAAAGILDEADLGRTNQLLSTKTD
jgi:outer membrane protein